MSPESADERLAWSGEDPPREGRDASTPKRPAADGDERPLTSRDKASLETIPAPILIVDDHPANLLALRAILEPLGQPVVEASSGEEALRSLLKEDYAVILMDVQMPGLDGFKTASIIKERPRTRHIPIIFLTALSRDAAHVFKGYAHGAVDYLLKPFDPEILRSKVSVFVELFRKGEQIKRQEALLREKERAEIEQRSERRYLAAIDSMPHCVWVLRPDGHAEYVNAATERLEQPDPGAKLWVVTHPEDEDRLRVAWEGALRFERPFEGQFRLRYRDSGEHRWHLVHGVPERDEGSAVRGWIVTATDFHDRKRAEERLSEFKATLDATYDAVLIFKPDDLAITYANEGSVRQLGFSREELLGGTVLKVDQCCEEPDFRKRMDRLVQRSGSTETYSTSFRRKDGSELPMEVVLQYIAGRTGGQFVMVARDVTERRRAEEALRATNDAKDAFLAAASHELRTPLQAAKGHAHLALMRLGENDAGPSRALKIIMKQIDRMAKLVEDLLDVSRIQAGRLALEVEKFNVHELLTEVAERMQPLSQSHPITVEGDLQLEVEADRSRIEQVVVNLLSNAIRYSPHGGPVTVSASPEDGKVHLAVSDRGVGIPKDKQEVIFERFGRAHGARYGGLGLGLTISHGIVAQHGGSMSVESSGVPGEGSTFHVRLPKQAQPVAEA